MKDIYIPECVDDYVADVTERVFPDERIAGNDFYRRLIGWVMDERTPLLYGQTHEGERTNMSINFNWLMTRDYTESQMGEEPAVRSLYGLHEATHMTHRLPTRLSEVTPGEYAEDFTASEYRASNESEIQVYYRVSELRDAVFPGACLAVDIMKARGVGQQPTHLLNQVRALLIEHDTFDYIAQGDPYAQKELARLKQFAGNRAWAREHYAHIYDRFADPALPQSSGLTDPEYEPVIASYEPQLAQNRYEANVIRNVRFAFAMCGLEVPLLINFQQAVEAAATLEGKHALV